MSLTDNAGVPFPELEAMQLSNQAELMVSLSEEDGSVTKESISKFVNNVYEEVSANTEPIAGYCMLKILNEYISQMTEKFKPAAQDAVFRLHKDERKYRGIDIALKNLPTTYSFDKDENWKKIKSEIEDKTKELKKREEQMMKAIGVDQLVVDGEIIPKPEYKSGGGETLQVSIPAKKKQ